MERLRLLWSNLYITNPFQCTLRPNKLSKNCDVHRNIRSISSNGVLLAAADRSCQWLWKICVFSSPEPNLSVVRRRWCRYSSWDNSHIMKIDWRHLNESWHKAFLVKRIQFSSNEGPQLYLAEGDSHRLDCLPLISWRSARKYNDR